MSGVAGNCRGRLSDRTKLLRRPAFFVVRLKAQFAQQLQFLLKRVHQVLGRIAIVVVAAARTGHGHHQFFVEAVPQAVDADRKLTHL